MDPKKVLVVDDEVAIQNVMRLQLEIAGYTVLCVADGKGALAAAEKDAILAVLLDLHLAAEDGFEVLMQFRTLHPQLPVIVVTGSHDQREARRAFDLGAWDYVTKPIDFNYLKNILLMQSPQ